MKGKKNISNKKIITSNNILQPTTTTHTLYLNIIKNKKRKIKFK